MFSYWNCEYKVSFVLFWNLKKILLYAVSRTRQGRQREPSVKTPFPTFCRILEALRVEWQNSTPHLASTPERRNGNINLSKYFISSSGIRTHNQSVLQSHLVPLRHDRPHSLQLRFIKISSLVFVWKSNISIFINLHIYNATTIFFKRSVYCSLFIIVNLYPQRHCCPVSSNVLRKYR